MRGSRVVGLREIKPGILGIGAGREMDRLDRDPAW